jgi:hypothetical protein
MDQGIEDMMSALQEPSADDDKPPIEMKKIYTPPQWEKLATEYSTTTGTLYPFSMLVLDLKLFSKTVN